MVADYRQIEKILQKATPKQRARMMAQNGLGGAFDADGSLTADFLRSLGENVLDGQTDTQGENTQGEGISADESVDYLLIGVADDGKKIYEGNFPKGTPKSVKSERILNYIQNVWSKKPITLVISNGETSRTIQAQFDPAIDETQNTPTDASKIAGGNRHGTSSEQRVTLDLADDYYQIASDAEYNYSKDETGKEIGTHDGVNMWHYFVNDIYFAEQGDPEHFEPYTVTINIKEKDNGEFVYSFNAEKESSTRRTLHADVNTRKGANGELFLDNSIPQNSDLSTGSGEKVAGNYDHRYMSPDLWRRTEVVDREIEKISRDSGEDVRVLSRELSENGKKEHRRLKQAFYTLSEASGGKLQMVVVEENKAFSGAYPHGNTIYISADAIENGTWTRALAEESTHFAQGTPEHSLLYAFLADDAELLAKVENELTKEGNSYKFTSIDAAVFRDYIDGKIEEELTGRVLRYGNEVTAHMSAELLSNEAVIDRLVSRHATLAERIMIKLRQIKRALSRIKDAKAQFERLTTAEQIYLAAIERRGWRFDGNKIIMGADDEELDNEEGIDYNRKSRGKTVRYISPQKIGTPTNVYIRKELEALYDGFDNMVADGIAISKGDKVYVVDSGKENGEVSFGVRKIKTISDTKTREKAIRRTNDDAISKGFVSDGLSQSRIRDWHDNRAGRDLRRESGTELSADQRESQNNQDRVFGEDADQRGVTEEKTYFRTKEQTADDFTPLLTSAGIEGEAAEIRGNLAELARMAKDADADEVQIKRFAKSLAMSMAQDGRLRDGETHTEATERLHKELLVHFDIEKAPKDTEDIKKAPTNEPKQKKTGYTYDDVNSMLDDIRKSSLSFETASGVVEGQLFRNDRWELGKRIYNTLKMDELGSKRELSRKIASLIVDAAKINEKGADGKTVQRRLADVLGKDVTGGSIRKFLYLLDFFRYS